MFVGLNKESPPISYWLFMRTTMAMEVVPFAGTIPASATIWTGIVETNRAVNRTAVQVLPFPHCHSSACVLGCLLLQSSQNKVYDF